MRRRALWLIVGIAGSVLIPLGLGGGLLTLVLIPASGGTLTAADALPAAAMAALGLGLGVPLALHGWAGGRAQISRPFNPAHVGWLWLALVLLIGLGTVIGLLPWATPLLLAPIHVLVMALPPLIMLWLVGRALDGMGGAWREVVVAVAGGGVLGMGVSLIGEVLVVVTVVVIVATVAATVPGGPERIAVLAGDLRNPAWQADLSNLFELLLSPAVVICVLGVFSVLVPLIEEACKTLAAGVVARWIRPHAARAFLWGVAGGAGFALVENMFSGALGGVEGWALGAVARFGTSVMHCLTGGLVGWGWGQLWTQRRPRCLLGAYVAAVAVHGLWNTAAIGVVLLGASTWGYGGGETWQVVAGTGMMALVVLAGLVTVMFVFALSFAGRKLAATAEHTPLELAHLEEVAVSRSSRVSQI
jgi:hypothetical protein